MNSFSKEYIELLSRKYREGTLSETEKLDFATWYSDLSSTLEHSEAATPNNIKDRIWSSIDLEIEKSGNKEAKRIKLWTMRNVAAAVILVTVSASLYLFETDYFSKSNLNRIANTQMDLNPGGNKARLMLASGKVIDLSSKKNGVVIDASKLTYSDGTAIPVESLAQENLTVTTPRGGTYQVSLPDGTMAWLNASSTLKFPASFKGAKTRRVELHGEAYFEIKHNAGQPFIVQTAGQVTEDIGTAFNINSYADETVTKTTLLEGSIKVNNVMLIPGQQSSLSANGGLKINSVNAEEAIDWKNGEFVLKNDNLKSIMRKISRWYDVDVTFQDTKLEEETFSGSVSRYGRVSEILKTLELTDRVHFKVEGRKVTVMN